MERLSICFPASSISRGEAKTNPIHYVAFDSEIRKRICENFKKAFGEEIIPFITNGATIPLCIGEPVSLDGTYKDEQERQEKYSEILSKYKQVQNQGDGIKSFTGILLYLIMDCFCTFLIDEPESFLHPPQAKIMGNIIGETLKKTQQAFIATHSEEIIKGLLEVCPERVKIVRITREENKNSFSILSNEVFNEVWNAPLLKYSNIMQSLFHKEVVLCESDSDCKMYSIIDEYLKQKNGKHSETLFIHCGGKHRMARISKALRSLGVYVKIITDIDVLNDEMVFKGIVEAYNIDWEKIGKKYKIIVSNLHGEKENINRHMTKLAILDIIDKSSEKFLDNSDLKQIREIISTSSKWENLKKMGISALPSGDATGAFSETNDCLKKAGIFIVTKGELECFIKNVGGHGPDWVNNVIETYPDFDNEVYKDIKCFVRTVLHI